MTKLELGSGDRPTAGYIHQEVRKIDGIHFDFIGNEWHGLKDNSLDEVLAVGVFEHFTAKEARENTARVYELLKKGGVFLFDVPDLKVWSEYMFNLMHGKEVPFDPEKIYAAFTGWQRFKGDEHKSLWCETDIMLVLLDSGFTNFFIDYFEEKKDSRRKLIHVYKYNIVQEFLNRNIFRNRFRNELDAHIYVKAVK